MTTNAYWINADIGQGKKWHLVYDKRPGLYFIEDDFEEESYDIESYRDDFPDSEVVKIPHVYKTKNPLGVCHDHINVLYGDDECPMCDTLFLYDRLKLALEIMDDVVCLLSEMPEISPGVDDTEKEEANLGKACKKLSGFIEYAKIGMTSETCSCDDIGEGRCPKHGFDDVMELLRKAKEGNGG